MSEADRTKNFAVEPETELFTKAAAQDLELFAFLHDREVNGETVKALRANKFQDQLSLLLQRSEAKKALTAFDEAIAEIPDPTENKVLNDLAADYACVYLRFKYRASPTESVWFDDDGLERQAPMFDVCNWYRRYGLKNCDWANRPDDHLVLQLDFLAYLLESACSNTDVKLIDIIQFMDKHILRWIHLFADQLKEAGAAAFYAALARITAVYLEELREHLQEITGIERLIAEDNNKPTDAPINKDNELPYVPGMGPGW